jgi:hypothetical protein
MNVSPVSAVASYNPPEVHSPAPASQSSSPIEDKVTLSPAAHQASAGVDVDHDGDSR